MTTTHATLLSAGARASLALSTMFLLSFQGPTALAQHPALVYGGGVEGTNSLRKDIPVYPYGSTKMAARTEGTAVSSTAITPTMINVTVVPKALAREPGDIARMTSADGALNVQALVDDALTAYNETLFADICAAIDGFTATKGTAGTDLTYETLLEAQSALDAAGVKGRLMVILHPTQWAHVAEQLALNVGGTIQFSAAAADAAVTKGRGFQGSLGRFDIWTSTDVSLTSGSYYGAVVGEAGVCWADGKPYVEPGTDALLIGDKVLFERDRQAAKGTTLYVSSCSIGVSIGIDARGVTIIST